MKPNSLDNERIENLMYLYGKTSIYSDMLRKCQSKKDFYANKNISYDCLLRKEKNNLMHLAKRKCRHKFKLPGLEEVTIKYEKKLISGIKTKVESHYHNDVLFYIHQVCSDLTEHKKKKMAEYYADQYLESSADFNYEKHNIVDSRGLVLSFCNIFNYSSNDFSIDFIIDKSKFPQT